VKGLDNSIDFYTALEFVPQFSDETTKSIVWSENTAVMLSGYAVATTPPVLRRIIDTCRIQPLRMLHLHFICMISANGI
jgi:hypothetical protein